MLPICLILAVLEGVVAPIAWASPFHLGVCLVVTGAAFGLPASAIYHWVLYRQAKLEGCLTPRWWWHPTDLHRLVKQHRWLIRFWFAVGAAGFAAIMIGCGAVVVAMAKGTP